MIAKVPLGSDGSVFKPHIHDEDILDLADQDQQNIYKIGTLQIWR